MFSLDLVGINIMLRSELGLVLGFPSGRIWTF